MTRKEMQLGEALKAIGLAGFNTRTRGGLERVLQRCKELMVAAEGNHEERVKLSQAKECFKWHGRRQCECGRKKHPTCRKCAECNVKYGGRWPRNPRLQLNFEQVRTNSAVLTPAH